jgi:hypothetical protein
MELLVSIVVLTLATMMADFTLAFRGNWSGIVALTLSAASYVAVLGVALRGIGLLGAPALRLPSWPFALAGVVAGAMGGLPRLAAHGPLFLSGMVLGGSVAGGMHFLAIRSWRKGTGHLHHRPSSLPTRETGARAKTPREGGGDAL